MSWQKFPARPVPFTIVSACFSAASRWLSHGVAQALAFFNFKLQQVQRLLSRGDIGEATVALQELRSGGQEVYDQVRQVIRDLSEAEASARWVAPPETGSAEELWSAFV